MGVELVLLGLVDRLAQQSGPPAQEAWEKQVERARSLLLAWYEGPEEHIAPTPFLRGDELMERFQVQAGPRLGELLEGLKEEQAAGSIASREEALDWVADQLGWISD